MPLNRVRGDMYAFINATWNPIKGKCLHDCQFCYMKRFPQNPIHLDVKELKVNLGESNLIFVGSGTDLFAMNVPAKWLCLVFQHMNRFNNQYFLQSKNVLRMAYYRDEVPNDTIFCTTIESNRNHSCMGAAPPIEDRVKGMMFLKSMFRKIMITIEPVLDFDISPLSRILIDLNPIQINIGADSKRHNLPEPKPGKLERLFKNLTEYNLKIHIKPNLKRLLDKKYPC